MGGRIRYRPAGRFLTSKIRRAAADMVEDRLQRAGNMKGIIAPMPAASPARQAAIEMALAAGQ